MYKLNSFLHKECVKNAFYFIDDSVVTERDIWKDRVHMVKSGKCLVANYFICHLNNFLGLTFSGPQGFCLSKILYFLIFLLTMNHKLRQSLFCYQHWSRFWEKFGDTGVPMVLQGSTSSLVGWKCSRIIYLKIC